jgi:hypothetical protein
MPPSMAAITGALSYMKLVSARNLEKAIFLLQFYSTKSLEG